MISFWKITSFINITAGNLEGLNQNVKQTNRLRAFPVKISGINRSASSGRYVNKNNFYENSKLSLENWRMLFHDEMIKLTNDC